MASNASSVLASLSPEERRKQMVRAVVASTVGTSIEWYDYFLFGTAGALVFAKLFFPKSDPLTGTLNTYAIFFAGFLARPVGAWLFGTFGDRVGRKATLIATLLFMGIATFLIGFMPTYGSIGLGAALLLLLLRLCQGIGVGGEWGGSVLMAMEWGSQKRKGFLGSWPQFGVPIGLVLANGIVALTFTLAGARAFEEWAWRIPFLLSIVLVAVGVYIVIALSLVPHDMQYGPQASLIAESFTGRLRYSGASLGYQLASIIAGGPAPFIATALFAAYGTGYAIAGYILACA